MIGHAPRKDLQMPLDSEQHLAAHEHTAGFKVQVLYNGLPPRELQVLPQETVKQALDQAIAQFGSLPNAHTLALYTSGGVELQDGKTIRESEIKPHDTLLLRPSTVKGG